MPKKEKKGKHLTLVDRMTIEHGLSLNWNFVEIAKRLSKNPTTIAKEVKKVMCGKNVFSIVHHFINSFSIAFIASVAYPHFHSISESHSITSLIEWYGSQLTSAAT